jgi:hypothetical protein
VRRRPNVEAAVLRDGGAGRRAGRLGVQDPRCYGRRGYRLRYGDDFYERRGREQREERRERRRRDFYEDRRERRDYYEDRRERY